MPALGLDLRTGLQPVVALDLDWPALGADHADWTRREAAYRFADHAAQLARRRRDQAGIWLTFSGLSSLRAPLAVTHHRLLAHGLAAEALRATLPPAAQIGLVLGLGPVRAASAAPADLGTAIRLDTLRNRLILDPVLRHAYPPDLVDPAVIHDGDLAVIGTTLDLLGISPTPTGSALTGEIPAAEPAGSLRKLRELRDSHRSVGSWGLTDLLCRLRDDYPDLPPLLVASPTPDTDADAVRAAVALGVDVFGMMS